MRFSTLVLLVICCGLLSLASAKKKKNTENPLSKFPLDKITVAIDDSAYIRASPSLLGLQGESHEWVTVEYGAPNPDQYDYIAVFSPSNFNDSFCGSDDILGPGFCTAPIKFKFSTDNNYNTTGKGSMRFRLINQREDFVFVLFSATNVLLAVSNKLSFAHPKVPLYPRLAQGKAWNEMTVTWTSGYSQVEAEPLVEWGRQGRRHVQSPAGTLTFSRTSMCGEPARTTGWRDPGFIHTSILKDLWPNSMYTYKMGHILSDGSFIWSKTYSFRSSPYPGQESIQRIAIFGDMGKGERDGSNDYNNYEYGALNTTDRLISDLKNIDMVMHIGDISYAMGHICQWDQFTEQIEPIASTVPYMIGSGNHERDSPGMGSFYENDDSGGECGVPTETFFYVPTENKDKFWYSTDYGMFRFCVADSERDWRPGTEQYKFLERCFASVDRQRQPWLIFLAHRVLGYSSDDSYAWQGSYGEPMGRQVLQDLWQKYKVDIGIYGHAHNYERTYPMYQDIATTTEQSNYVGPLKGTIHVVAGCAGFMLDSFTLFQPVWSLRRTADFGYVKLTAFNHSTLLYEYIKSNDGSINDTFTITREYRDLLTCTIDNCRRTTLAN